MLAPVRWLKSGARRCSGSAICGPVNVRTVTSTPLSWSAPVPWVDWVLLSLPPLQAAASSDTAAINAAQRENGRLSMLSSHAVRGRHRPTRLRPQAYRSPVNIRCLGASGRRVDVADGEQLVGVEPLVAGGD